MKKYFPGVIIIIVSIFFSCGLLKKNVMKDIADDVNEVVMSQSGGENFLVVKQEIFQATSKSDKGGIRQITGYVEYRITSYDLNTGQISKRIETGDREVNPIFLGKTEGKLWYKSFDKELGFHARDPKTLDVIVAQSQVTDANPFLNNNLSQPPWNDINRYYGFDIEKNMPMVSDNSGFVYYVDPGSLKADKTSESIKNFDFDNTSISTSMKMDVNRSINLSGSPRCYINYSGKELKDVSFLKGEFLKSSNIMTESEANADYLLPYRKEIEKINKEIDSINNFISAIDTSEVSGQAKYTSKNNISWANRSIERARDNLKRAEDNIKRYSDDDMFDIVTKDNCVFVMSQTDVTDQARVIISKIKLNADTTVTQVWQTELKDIYRDPDKGFDKSSFDVVFSKGNPDLRTMRVIEGKDKLVFIFQLRATCIDVQSGNILWQSDM